MDRRTDFEAWRLFCEVIRTGSISHAASEIGLDTASASRRLTELEQACGESLLNRKKRPISGTIRGDALFDAVSPVIDAFEDFCRTKLLIGRSGGRTESLPQQVISISTIQGYGHECLPPLLHQYMEENPSVSFRLFKERSIADLERGEIDVLVTASEVNRPGLLRQDTRLLPCILACSPDYLLKHGMPNRPSDLIHHIGLVRMGENFPVSHMQVFNGRQSYQLNFAQTICSEDSIGLRDSAVAGLGIVFDLPAEFMVQQIIRGELVLVLPGWHRKPFQRSVLVNAEQVKNRPDVQAFADWLTVHERKASFEREYRAFSALGVSARDYL
mgnify:CR=1 FL=1